MLPVTSAYSGNRPISAMTVIDLPQIDRNFSIDSTRQQLAVTRVESQKNAELAAAMMSINAVKGVEIGAGFACIEQKGSEHGDRAEQRQAPRVGFDGPQLDCVSLSLTRHRCPA